jgi:hypothetical protein
MSNAEMLEKGGRETRRDKGRVFTVDLASGSAIRAASLGNGTPGRVLIEGTLGRLKHVGFLEEAVLEVTGTEGILRLDLTREELSANRLQVAGRRRMHTS